MGKKTSAAGVVAVIVVAVTAWVLNSDDAHSKPGAAPQPAASRPEPGTDGAQARLPASQVSGADAAPARAVQADAHAAARKPDPHIVPAIDWARYPGTLNTQIQQALQGRDGVMAADLARKLRECEAVAGQMQPDILQTPVVGDAALHAVRKERLQEYQRILANCQTVADGRRARLELLELAMAQKVVGAAVQGYHLGLRRPDVLQAVVRDALAGDVSSLAPVTYHAPSAFSMAPDLQRSLRYAFELAAHDPEVGTLVQRYLAIAESMSVPLAKEAQPRFNHDGLTDAQRAQAQATASQLVRRVKEPRDEVAKAG